MKAAAITTVRPRLPIASAVMPSKPVFLVSDLHLGAVPPGTEEAFRRWLLHVKEAGSRLIINGDLFDFWFEYRRVVLSEHVRVLAGLADLVESGVPVLLMGGNHDWWGGDFLRDRIGLDFHQNPVRIQLKGKSMLVAHGDGLGTGDFGYRCLRLFLRNRLTRWLFRWLHPDLGAWLAERVSGTRKEKEAGPGPLTAGRAAFIQAWASELLARDSTLDIIAAGHAHSPTVEEVSPGRYYVNSGDWILHRSYVTIGEDGAPVLHEWDG